MTRDPLSRIPGKVPSDLPGSDPWPDLGDCPPNLFHRHYRSAEGWVGEGYLMMWDRETLESAAATEGGTLPGWHFFASDGGGTQFAVIRSDDKIVYGSASDIGGAEGSRVLGGWDAFLDGLATGDYL